MADNDSKASYLVGVDLGGTKILAGVFDHEFSCLARMKLSTKAERGPEGVMERVARCGRHPGRESPLRAQSWLEGCLAEKGAGKATRRARVRGERLQTPHPRR